MDIDADKLESALQVCRTAVANAATAVATLQDSVTTLMTLLSEALPCTPHTGQPGAYKPWIWPVAGIPPRITQHFDAPVAYANRKHEGCDIDVYDDNARTLCNVVSVTDGTVTHVNHWNKTTSGWQSYGNYVEVCGDDGYTVMYCHLSEIAAGLVEHQRVVQGQVLGVGGNTGHSLGAHLHISATHPDAAPVYVFNQRCVNIENLLPKP